jgi:excisionase family DNA binding protein
MAADFTPLYVRLSNTDAQRLDAAVAATGRTKRQLVSDAVRDQLDQEHITVGRIALREEAVEVMTLAEASAWLRVDDGQLRAAAENGELPGRRIGDEWRFSRAALVAWLGGPPSPDAERPRNSDKAPK